MNAVPDDQGGARETSENQGQDEQAARDAERSDDEIRDGHLRDGFLDDRDDECVRRGLLHAS